MEHVVAAPAGASVHSLSTSPSTPVFHVEHCLRVEVFSNFFGRTMPQVESARCIAWRTQRAHSCPLVRAPGSNPGVSSTWNTKEECPAELPLGPRCVRVRRCARCGMFLSLEGADLLLFHVEHRGLLNRIRP